MPQGCTFFAYSLDHLQDETHKLQGELHQHRHTEYILISYLSLICVIQDRLVVVLANFAVRTDEPPLHDPSTCRASNGECSTGGHRDSVARLVGFRPEVL
jgi:hypothetical protein